jgi:anti-sigma regulatory factor (Ser/Thr protein kinase)
VDTTVEAKAAELPSLTAEVVFYAAREAIRNAARYGRGGRHSDPLRLLIAVTADQGWRIVIEDDGDGLRHPEYAIEAGDIENAEATPEFSDVASKANSSGGAGRGLALHSTMMAVVGGSLEVESVPGQFTRVVLSLPQGIGENQR